MFRALINQVKGEISVQVMTEDKTAFQANLYFELQHLLRYFYTSNAAVRVLGTRGLLFVLGDAQGVECQAQQLQGLQ